MFRLQLPFDTVKKVGAAMATVALISTVTVTPASAYAGSPWFVPNQPYAAKSTWTDWSGSHPMTLGDLADPDVFRDSDGTYYAYGTSMGGRNVPLVVSKDLNNWTTNQAYKPQVSAADFPANGNDSYYNDTLVHPGNWAAKQANCNTSVSGCYEIWAPSVEKAGNGDYIMAYAAHMNGNYDKFCIGIATSRKATGPFVDDSSSPTVCSSDSHGAIDPDLYKDTATGKLYLYWKNEGSDRDPNQRTKFHVRELNANTGTSWATNSNANDNLLEVSPFKNIPNRGNWGESWANPVIENPSMINYNGQYYLFFSGNEYASDKYAVGYAKCTSPAGGCTVTATPILKTDNDLGLVGPGGASAFIDNNNQLRFAYAAWTRPAHPNYDATCDVKVSFWGGTDNGCIADQRFLRLATVGVYGNNKMLAVTQKASNLVNPAFSVTNVSSNTPKTFSDVNSADMFAKEINWLSAVGITTGYNDGTYRQLQSIQRNAMAAYLYRMAGSPDVNLPSKSPFFDVRPGDPFYKEIIWTAQTGISRGWPDGTFRPYDPIHRDAMAAFLYRLEGYPSYKAPTDSPFADVSSEDQFYKEISWMASQGISTGWPDHTYRPLDNINRDAMAAFIYRTAEKGYAVAY